MAIKHSWLFNVFLATRYAKQRVIVVVSLVIAGLVFYIVQDKTDNFRTTLEWSKISSKEMSWYDAKSYCDNLNENGSEDWRLPTIDDLRKQVNCPATEPDGECQISEINGKLSENDLTNACEGCRKDGSGKLGDTDWLWSSSSCASSKNRAWSVYFGNGIVQSYKKESNMYVRCVR